VGRLRGFQIGGANSNLRELVALRPGELYQKLVYVELKK